MATETTNKPVSVDPGDVLEATQAAQAWAAYLRNRATDKRKSNQDDKDYRPGDSSLTTHFEDEAAADRIDQACARLTEDTHKSMKENR